MIDTCPYALLSLLSVASLLLRARWPIALHQSLNAITAVLLQKTSASSCTLLSQARFAAERLTFDSLQLSLLCSAVES